MKRKSLLLAVPALACLVGVSAMATPSSAQTSGPSRAKMSTVAPAAKPSGARLKLMWQEEFNGSRGVPSTIQTATRHAKYGQNWATEITGNPYNHERQYYTDDVVQFNPNGSIAHWAIEQNGKGQLAINARVPQAKTAKHRGTYPPDLCGYGKCEFVSGRMNTKHKLSFRYGYIVARVKVPTGGGTWPAFWMLGTDIDTNSWPACGEIDIMEASTSANFFGDIVGSLHSWPDDGYGITSRFTPDKPTLYEGYHTVGIRWLPGRIDFYADGKVYQSVTKKNMTSDSEAVYVDSLGQTYNREWPFDKDFFIILNLAMGGYFGGEPDDNYKAPSDSRGGTLLVDWIRAYSINGIGKVTRHK